MNISVGDIASLVAVVVSIATAYSKHRDNLPDVSAAVIPIFYGHSRKDQALVQLTFHPGKRRTTFTHVSSPGGQLCISGEYDRSSLSTALRSSAEDLKGEFSTSGRSISWEVPSFREADAVRIGFVCIRRYDLNSNEEIRLPIKLKCNKSLMPITINVTRKTK